MSKKVDRLPGVSAWPRSSVLLVALSAIPALAGSNSTTLPNGAELSVSIDSPADGTQSWRTARPFRYP